MSALRQRINDDVKEAMRARQKERLGTLRLILAAIKQKEVDERVEIDDPAVLTVLDKMARQHRDSIEQFRSAGRDDLVAKEQSELEIVAGYLPQPLSDEQVRELITAAISETGAASVKDMGRVMAVLKPRLQGRTDMGQASALVKAALG
jgi:uncharacterized protein YqeY